MKAPIDNLESLYAAFESLDTEGGWHRRQPALWEQPRHNFHPKRWSYRQIKPILEAAGELVNTEFAERRNLTMRNPVEGNAYATVNSIVAAYQMIKPGEKARSHRHTPNALRMILEGTGTFTIVDGQRIEMCPGDVLLTPNWHWHAHEATGTDDCFWMDFLDVPLVHLLEPMFFERHPDEFESDVRDVDSSPMVFTWSKTLERLAGEKFGRTPQADKSIQLGSPALDTLALYMQQIDKSSNSSLFQTTANSVFAVARGSGSTEVGDKVFHWEFGDTIAIPCWQKYRHLADEDTILLRITDEPVMRKLGWYREKTH